MDKDDIVALMDDKEEDKKEKEAKVVEDDQVQGRQAKSQAKIYKIDLDHTSKVLSMQEDEPAEVQEVVDVVTTAKLITSTIVSAAEPQVLAATITAAPVRVVAASTKKGNEWLSGIQKKNQLHTQSYMLIPKPKIKAKGLCPSSKEYDKYLKNVAGFRLDYFKGMSYDDIRPIFEVKFNSNMDFLLKTKEQIEEEENRVLQSINETPAQKAAKRRKLNEEVEDLKRHLEIMPDKDDDVYTESTPLARKVPVMDYEIINLNNKPYYKIIRADGTHQLYISFLTLLKNFDREDLEALWNLVKESMARGRSRGLTSLWDPNMFVKKDIWCDDAFVIIKGKWKILDGNYLMINICGPHDSSSKATLWNRIDDFIRHNNGAFMLFGDLNEMNKAGTKLSKLDRFLLSDNVIEALLAQRSQAKIKVWLRDTKNIERRHKEKVLVTLKNLDVKIDSNITSLEDRKSCTKLLHDIDKIDRLETLELLQKLRIKWDIEGDENSKFFHCLVNQIGRTNCIHGIMSDGTWVTNMLQVKESFMNFFKEKFQPHDFMIDLPSITFPSNLSSSNHDILEKDVTLEEIKSAVWDCGNDKATGHDGFPFGFIKRYWELLKNDNMEFVTRFLKMKMRMGSNSSFITLIQKVGNPIHIKDYRPISLINIHYKIIAKVLAKQLAKVVDIIVSHEQYAFISGRQILDGSLISDMIDWYKKRKKKMLIFKVDFEKAFDSVGRKYLDYMLHNLSFGLTWMSWIKACLESSRTSILVNGSPTSEFSVKRGLRQRDILSPFLFIIVMEGLHMALSEASHSGLINDWSPLNMDNIICVLQVFYLAPGLKINIHKSNFMVLVFLIMRMISIANALWVKVVKSFHGQEGGFGLYENSSNGIWSKIVGSSNYLHSNAILPSDSIRFRVGCGLLHIGSFQRQSVDLDVCYWTIANNDMFSVSSTRQHIDSYFMFALDILTQSNKTIPHKVNIFIWRFMLDRLPHRLNLSREINIHTIGFSSCNGNVESSNHIFFGCGIANDIWSNVRNWCDITFHSCSSFDHWKKLRLEEIDDVESNALVGKPFKMPGLKKETTDYAVSESNEEDVNKDENSIDKDNVINEVDIDIQELYQNIDKDVEWVGPSNGTLEVPAQMDVEEGYDLDDYDMYINCDSDVESSKEKKKRMRALRKESKNKAGHFYVGQEFADKKETTTLVTCQAVATRRKLYVWKNDKVRVRAVCRRKCLEFTNSVGPIASGLNSPCKGKLKQVNGKWVKSKTLETSYSKHGINKVDRIRIKVENNTWTVKTYNDEHICLQTREVKLLTDKWLSNEIEDIVKPNPSILVKALKEQLQKNYQVGISKGKLLTAVGIDANHGDDLDLNPMSNSTFISDRQKGILPAIAQVFLCSKHRLCIRHIYENFKAQWKGNQFKELVWRCVAAIIVPYFDRQMEKLKSLDEGAYEYLKKIPPQHWSISYFSGRANYDVLLNNLCEVFNRQ
nr:putative RNA-directed DNA polymerase, eukaryota, reverse transcriptase zinc-binding domain protein [Tanacetum cinerariifolium]